ncbi:MAG: MaoC/PaaZ C-terminal domain-containing protein, partial [Ilumatobacteraceae bacterium]
MTPEEAKQGIHIGHDLIIARRVRPGESITVHAHIAAVARRASGATQVTMFVASDDAGDTVWRTRFTSLFLGVELEGEPSTEATDWPPLPESVPTADPLASRQSFVRSIDAHVYSECARIWNPIHTDITAARRAGLAAPILHGTATLARAISIATDLADVPLAAVSRVACQFGSMVTPGSTLDVRLLAVNGNALGFDVLDEGGRGAVSNATIHLRR